MLENLSTIIIILGIKVYFTVFITSLFDRLCMFIYFLAHEVYLLNLRIGS